MNNRVCPHASVQFVHGVDWAVWDRMTPDNGPWPCTYCGVLVTIHPDGGFVVAPLTIPEEP